MELFRTLGPTGPCSYLPEETSTLDYRYIIGIRARDYERLLVRGWRRFGRSFFRPVCAACSKCRGLRVICDEFAPSKSLRRTLKRNRHIRIEVGKPTVDDAHLELYDIYHKDMSERRGWPEHVTEESDYVESFVQGAGSFAREFRYYKGTELYGVGLVDVLSEGLSSVYFYHHPDWRPQAPGVFSVLTEIAFARRSRKAHLYLGYWIAENQSMQYKAKYKPHELLQAFVEDEQEPVWTLAEDFEV